MDERKKKTERVVHYVKCFATVLCAPYHLGIWLSNALNAGHACSLGFLADDLAVYSWVDNTGLLAIVLKAIISRMKKKKKKSW